MKQNTVDPTLSEKPQAQITSLQQPPWLQG